MITACTVLIDEELYGAQELDRKLSPAYQNPDRRGRARITRSYKDDQDERRSIRHTSIHTCVSES